jgi:hypothetical protein
VLKTLRTPSYLRWEINEAMGKFNLIPCRVLLLQFFIIFPCAFSLHVVFGSNCTALCSYQNPLSNTTSVDVTCSDKNYEKTSVGRTFKDCVTCEFESISFDHGTRQTDLGWGLCMSINLSLLCFGSCALYTDIDFRQS